MSVPISELKGMTAEVMAKLKGQGVLDSDALLAKAGTPAARRELAEATGVAVAAILELANRADLARINGIGALYSNLLEQAGVDTVPDLAHRRPDNLLAKLTEINGDAQFVKRLPPLSLVEKWVAQAKALPRAVEY